LAGLEDLSIEAGKSHKQLWIGKGSKSLNFGMGAYDYELHRAQYYGRMPRQMVSQVIDVAFQLLADYAWADSPMAKECAAT
jgi:hypothetical protein